ncbi:hypothetical protein IW261DRAFT_1681060 [Armillaria novae-zelandiae]|uniref:Fungal-type protein kinase domain-containing protein n=1 Tax=Armillaria novae-zelandiae TaxID=153914 RepID=A0AA39PBW8_9AGAR|nr:hypothetical protein IW261DRAFT_1681060 [Armillaria novae-zelandiae]
MTCPQVSTWPCRLSSQPISLLTNTPCNKRPPKVGRGVYPWPLYKFAVPRPLIGRTTPPQSERQFEQPSDDSSPIKSQINNESTTIKVPATELRKDWWKEMEGHWVGPMPVQEFLDDFLRVPGSESRFRSPSHLHGVFNSIKSPEEYTSERAYAQAINTAIQGIASELIPCFQFVLGNEFKDRNVTITTAIDGFIYESTVDTSSCPTQWDKAELWAKFKGDSSYHGFEDNIDDGWMPQTESSRNVRAQLTRYASNALNAQCRKYLFSLFLSPDGVRFFKWERTYTIVSRAFKLTTDGKYLVEFLYRFCTLTDGGRGKDDTVTPATAKEIALAKKFLKPSVHGSDPPRPFVKIRVFGPAGDQKVVAGPHIAAPRSAIGRATLGLPVYDIDTKTVMFLKDSWRDNNLPQESVILQALNDKEVRSVPTLVCGGVVLDQVTTSYTYTEKEWNDGAHPTVLCIRVHQRTLTEEVEQPLRRFKSSKQLTRVVYDAFLGHEDAFTKCGYLHRDISGGNILIVYDAKAPKDDGDGGGRGLLNDWDMAIKIADLAQARQTERTGTWQFMSIRHLRDRTKKHSPQDDFESFVYVMLYHGLRYLCHNKVGPCLPDIISAIFDVGNYVRDGMRGGNGKVALIIDFGDLGRDFRFDSAPFHRCIMSGLGMIRKWQYHLHPPPGGEAPADDTLKFANHNSLRSHWEEMLAMDGWPANDVYQPKSHSKKRPSVDEPLPVSKRKKSGYSLAVASQV